MSYASMKKADIQGGIMLLVTILLIGGFFLFAKTVPQLTYGPVEITGSTLAATPNSDLEVTVSGTFLKPSFVTIHQAMGTAPGDIVGTSNLIPAGTTDSIVVHLTKPMVYAGPYVALLHADNGDGAFVVKDDLPVTSDSKTVRADFNAPVTAPAVAPATK